MSWQTGLLKSVTRLPKYLNIALMTLNRNPVLVFGGRYGSYRKKLSEGFSGVEIEQLLLSSVNNAIRNVPYYQSKYGDVQIRSLPEFEETIGFIDKDIILDNHDAFIKRDIDLSGYDRGTTGGTSGRPLKLIAPKGRYVVEMATMHSLWERAGFRFDVRGVIRNHRLNEGDFMVNPITREVVFDGFRLNDEYFAVIYRVLRALRIRFIHCYPSTACEFATFLLRKELDVSFISAFLSGSENIFDYQLDLIQGRLGIRFYNWYGHSEKLVLAGYCERTNDYHVEPGYGYFELINEKGHVIKEPGQTGEIVGTSFHNPGMPFIRYRTGDVAEFVSDNCPACNRHVPIIRNIKGRWSGDRIYNADGTFVTTTALNLHGDLYSVINGLQYVQERKGKLEVLIVKSNEYKPQHEKALYDQFRRKLKPDTEVTIHNVEQLRRMPNGKIVHLISSVVPDISDQNTPSP